MVREIICIFKDMFHLFFVSGLENMLKKKFSSFSNSGHIYSSIRFTYIVSDFPHTFWTQTPPDFDATLSDVGFSELGKLPFGALSDPVR